MVPTLPQVLLLVAALNGWTMMRFWQDKRRARAGDRRIPEADLLALAAFGGSPRALLARRMFRHKTRNEPYSPRLPQIFMVHHGVLTGLAVAFA